MKDGPRPGWSASCRATVADSSGVRETVELVGTFLAGLGRSSRGRTTGAFGTTSTGAFGTVAWTGAIPALGLELAVGRSDDALPTLPLITDPGAAGRLLEDALQGRTRGPGSSAVGPR